MTNQTLIALNKRKLIPGRLINARRTKNEGGQSVTAIENAEVMNRLEMWLSCLMLAFFMGAILCIYFASIATDTGNAFIFFVMTVCWTGIALILGIPKYQSHYSKFGKDLDLLIAIPGLNLTKLGWIKDRDFETLAHITLFQAALKIDTAEKDYGKMSDEADEARKSMQHIHVVLRRFNLGAEKWDEYFVDTKGWLEAKLKENPTLFK